MRSGTGAVCSAISSIASEPYRMRQPSTGISSFSADGESLERTDRLAALVPRLGLARRLVAPGRPSCSVSAFTIGSTPSARARTDASSSTGESSFARIRASASVAVSSQGSVMR